MLFPSQEHLHSNSSWALRKQTKSLMGLCSVSSPQSSSVGSGLGKYSISSSAAKADKPKVEKRRKKAKKEKKNEIKMYWVYTIGLVLCWAFSVVIWLILTTILEGGHYYYTHIPFC